MIRKRFCWCLFVRIRSGWANVVRFLSVVNVLLMMVFIDFMCSMNAVVVCEFMMRDFLVCSLWTWCGNHSVIVVSSVESCVFSWDCKNDARSWIICCAKRRGLTGNGRISRFVMFAFSMDMSAGDVIMNAWDDSTLRSYLYVRDDDEDCDDILSKNRIVDDVHSLQTWYFNAGSVVMDVLWLLS